MASDRLRQRIQDALCEYLSESYSESTQRFGQLPAFIPISHICALQSQETSVSLPVDKIFFLDEELACLQNVRETIAGEISARAVRISAYRNSLLPIHQLPPEILSYILEVSLGHFDTAPERSTTQRLLALASVSRHWRALLDQIHSIWGWIDRLQDASFAVHKSGQAPLSINLVNEGQLENPELQPGLATLLPHSNRWQSLQLRLKTPCAREFASTFESLSAPSLRDLGFIVNARGVSNHPTINHLERYPLRRLVLRGIGTSWDTVAGLTELRSLTIADLTYGDGWPSREQIVNILLGCPHLEELTLSNLENHPPDLSLPPPSQWTLSLPALRSVAFNDILNTREAALWLLDCIATPNLSGLSVMGMRGGRGIDRPMASVLKRQRTGSPLPVVMAGLGLRPVHVQMTQHWCRIDCEHVVRRGGHKGLEIYIPGARYVDIYQAVVDVVSDIMGDPPLHLHIEKLQQRYEPNPDPDPNFLGHLPSLSVLSIERVPNVAAFLQYLCSVGSGHSVEYFCPNLTEVRLLDTSLTRTEMQSGAAETLMEKRPDIALYDETGRRFSRISQ